MRKDDLMAEFNLPSITVEENQKGGIYQIFFYLMSKLKTNHDKKYFAIDIFNSII